MIDNDVFFVIVFIALLLCCAEFHIIQATDDIHAMAVHMNAVSK